ncbi:M1 family metallopeptidase [Flavobacterium lindanitolerans]|uniref:M1 family metallopeptidase n=1 Tax=Flavobacterium lindanitolerans TaxID=428988 RepID=UPI00280A21FB|nr:M1 family metallopeptidase [Flavobacterium lindanitolerans]MDQ7961138.1 M1 family metallopeptidase [Flavobacterium lindanitolerans]
MKRFFPFFILLCGLQNSLAQEFTRKDSLRGGFSFERICYDVQRYDLNITINPEEKSIRGYNDITFKTVKNTQKIQVDLFENMKIDSIIFDGRSLEYKREFDAVFITFPKPLNVDGTDKTIRFYYSGTPQIAKYPPWDGGFVFKTDNKGKPWIGVAVQGTGASLWYPVKDSQSDEPDFGATIKVAVPDGLMNVSNGRFKGSENLKNGYTRWDWEVKSPINTYDITVNIADYVHIHDNHNGLDLDYYVLPENEEKAKKHFEEVKPMLDCFEAKFGKYPFAEDGYKLVETSYLGMEHQSAVAYGNKYRKGYQGSDISGTGIGLLFDYITIHESGHEWFGNSITSKDIADLWIHEGFTTYSESVFVECLYGYEKAMEYINGQKKRVSNRSPIIGYYGVNDKGSTDMYYKGALLLNTLRHIVNDDEKWWKILLKYSETYRHKIIDTQTVIAFFNTETGRNLTPVFEQYLRYKNIPELEVAVKNKEVKFRWITDVPDFKMPIIIKQGSKETRLEATNKWKSHSIKNNDPVKFDDYRFLIKITYN